MKEEIWRDVEGYEGIYQVSNWGRVKSLARESYNGKGYYIQKERILKTPANSSGYYCCNLCLNGKLKSFRVHVLVAIAFLNHSPNGHKVVIDHINNVKTDNRLENLQLISNRENTSKDRKGGSSEYVGVYWCKRYNKWHARIKINGERKHLGYFFNEIQAAEAYQLALNKILVKLITN